MSGDELQEGPEAEEVTEPLPPRADPLAQTAPAVAAEPTTGALHQTATAAPPLELPPTAGADAEGIEGGARLAPRQKVAGRFALVRLLGRGGMGAVYLARDTRLGREVAIKTLAPGAGAATDMWLQVFRREAASTARLQHPNILTLYDFGVEDGVPYLVLEYLRGETLSSMLERGPLEVTRAVALARQLTAALEHAHAEGVVHRDLKPSNLVVAGAGHLSVLDFGVALMVTDQQALQEAFRKSPRELERYLGQAHGTAGTPLYMAPEQLAGEAQDGRTDLWAAGVVLFEMLAGQLPFTGLTASLFRDAPRLSELGVVVPEALEALVAACLQRDPELRPEGASVVQQALAAIHAELDRPVAPPSLGRRTNLEPLRDPFVGREAELESLGEAFEAGARLVTLLGLGGVGKTRLALEYGAAALDAMDAVFFCDLAESRSATDVMAAVAEALDVPLTEGDPAGQLAAAVAGRGRVLLILDNLEQVIEPAAEVIARWLQEAPRVAALATSRQPLGLTAERVVSVEPLAAPPEDATLEELEACAAVQLFAARAGRRFTLGPHNVEDVAALVRALDGLPLAIALAAARARVMSPARMLDMMGRRFDLLRTGSRQVPERQATLMGALDWSWDLLEPWEQAFVAQASVFEGGFSLDAAEAVVDLSAWTQAPFVMDVLEALMDKCLLRPQLTEGDASPRFGWLVSVEAWAAHKLRSASAPVGGEAVAAAARRRHGEHFAAFGAPEALADARCRSGLWRLREMVAEAVNLGAASRWLADAGELGLATQAAVAYAEVCLARGPFERGVALLDGLLSRRALADADAVELLDRRVQLQLTRGEPDLAFDDAKEMLERSAADTRGPGYPRALSRRGRVAINRGSYDEAERFLQQALLAAQERGDRVAEGDARDALGLTAFRAGELEAARQQWEAARELLRSEGDLARVAAVTGNTALVAMRQGEHEEARDGFTRALELSRLRGDHVSEALWLTHLAAVAEQERDYATAIAMNEGAIAVAREIGHVATEGLAVGHTAILHHLRGDLAAARDGYTEALQLARQAGQARTGHFWLHNLSLIDLQLGHLDSAMAASVRLLEVARGRRERAMEVGQLGNIGTIACLRGRHDEARQAHREALGVAEEQGLAHAELECYGRLGLVELAARDLPAARVALERAVSLSRRLEDRHNLGLWLGKLAVVDLQEGHLEKASARIEEAEALLRELDAKVELVELLCDRGALDVARGEVRRARRALEEAEGLAAPTPFEPESSAARAIAGLRMLVETFGQGGT